MFKGWLAEEWYNVNRHVDSTSHHLQCVCFLSFDASALLDKVEALIRECLTTMESHTPSLRWWLGTYELEGSLSHSCLDVPESSRFWRASRSGPIGCSDIKKLRSATKPSSNSCTRRSIAPSDQTSTRVETGNGSELRLPPRAKRKLTYEPLRSFE